MDQFLDPETDTKHQFLDPETVGKCQFLVKILLDPETDIMDQFLDPETDIKHQFLVPEIDKKCQFLDGRPETDVMDQFLDPETDIMGEGNYIDLEIGSLKCFDFYIFLLALISKDLRSKEICSANLANLCPSSGTAYYHRIDSISSYPPIIVLILKSTIVLSEY